VKEKYPNIFVNSLSMLVGALLMCLPHAAFAQENQDTVLTVKDTIITINDTIIRISEDSISTQGRGDSAAVITTENGADKEKWKKLTHVFKKDSTINFNVIGFPIVAYLPETNLSFGGTLQLYFRQRKTPDNHQSVFRFKGQYTLNKQYEAFMEYELFLGKNNRIWMDGIVQYQNWLQDFYGIGNNTEYESREITEFQHWYSDLRLLYEIKKLYIGPQVRFSKIFDMQYAADSTFARADVSGKNGYQTVGIGAALVLDTRDNNIFPYKGYYISLSNYNHPKWSSEEQFSFYNLEFDYRHFFNPKKGKHVLAVRAYMSANFGEPPFRLMALHGGQYLGRGYYEGRYRDMEMWLAQVEWRFPLVWRFRGTLFTSAGDVARVPSDFSFQTINWAVGVGLRFVVNPKERNMIRMDYAHGKTKEDKGFYFGVNEVY